MMCIDASWLKDKGLKIGDMVLVKMNDKILIEVPKTEEELHAEILSYEKELKAKAK